MTIPKPPLRTALLTALLMAATALLIAGLQPLRSDLYWWHTAVGEFISTWQAIPDQQLFLFTVDPEAPWVYGSWLGAVALSVFDEFGGAELSLLVRNLAVAFCVAAITYSLARRTGKLAPTLIAAALATTGFVWFLPTEPQALAAPVAVIAVLAAWRLIRQADRLWIALVLPLGVLAVVNLDVSVAIGLTAVGIVTAAELIRVSRGNDEGGKLIAAAFACAAAVPATIFGFAYALAYWPQTLQSLFSPPALAVDSALVAIITAALVGWLWRAGLRQDQPPRLITTILLAVTAAMALFAPTTTAVFLTVATLLFADLLTNRLSNARGFPSGWRLLAALIVVTAAAVVVQPGVDTRAPILNTIHSDLRDTPPHTGTISEALPLRCAEELRAARGEPRVFHHPDHAGFLLAQLLDAEQPRAMLFDDHRHLVDQDLRQRAELVRSDAVARGIFQSEGIDAAVLDRQLYPEAVQELDDAPEWHDLREERNERFGCFVLVDPNR